jgi:TRAP-type mannitol/chloroaromatic compound transport system permease small subunit
MLFLCRAVRPEPFAQRRTRDRTRPKACSRDKKLRSVVMKTVIAIMRVINIVNAKIARIVSFCMPLFILSLVYEVFARYVFGAPTTWSFDATYFLCSLAMMLTMAYTWQMNGHVGVDIFLKKLPIKVQAAWLSICLILLFFVSWIMIIGVMISDVINSWRILEHSTIGFLPPIYPFKTWILIGTIMLAFQGFNVLVKELYLLIKGKELII